MKKITEKEKEWLVKLITGKVSTEIHVPKELCKTKEEVIKYIEGEKNYDRVRNNQIKP